MSFTLLEDVNGDIAEKYGVLPTDRGYFLIDSEGKVRKRLIYDLPIGIRAIDYKIITMVSRSKFLKE